MKEKCGLFGAISLTDENVTPVVYIGIRSLQHRGQEAWGIANSKLKIHKQSGLVTENLKKSEPALKTMKSNIAIGHVRYSTAGGKSMNLAQPYLISKTFSIAHNGTVCDVRSLQNKLTHKVPKKFNDTYLVGHRLKELLSATSGNWFKAIKLISKELVGAYCFIILTKNEIIAFRDPRGFRPLSIGYHRPTKSHIVTSESCALTVLNAKFVRDVLPGEAVILSKNGIKSYRFSKKSRFAHCSFEYTYFAHPSSLIDGISVYKARKNLGMKLAELYDVEGDVVIPVPDSARPAALGFSEKSKIPFAEGLMKDRYGKKGGLRSFIQPTNKDRIEINKRVIPVVSEIQDKNVIVIDDSIVRGISSKNIVKTLKKAGAKSVKVLVTYPPIRHPCRAGIDFPTQEELLVHQTNEKFDELEQINKNVRKSIKADFLGYNDVTSLSDGIGKPENELCISCHTGEYGVLNPNLD